MRDIKNLTKHEEEHYYKPSREGSFWSNCYIQYKSNGDRNKTVSIEEYHNKIGEYLKYIINNLKNYHTGRIQLIIDINFVSTKNNDEERVMY